MRDRIKWTLIGLGFTFGLTAFPALIVVIGIVLRSRTHRPLMGQVEWDAIDPTNPYVIAGRDRRHRRDCLRAARGSPPEVVTFAVRASLRDRLYSLA